MWIRKDMRGTRGKADAHQHPCARAVPRAEKIVHGLNTNLRDALFCGRHESGWRYRSRRFVAIRDGSIAGSGILELAL